MGPAARGARPRPVCRRLISEIGPNDRAFGSTDRTLKGQANIQSTGQAWIEARAFHLGTAAATIAGVDRVIRFEIALER